MTLMILVLKLRKFIHDTLHRKALPKTVHINKKVKQIKLWISLKEIRIITHQVNLKRVTSLNSKINQKKKMKISLMIENMEEAERHLEINGKWQLPVFKLKISMDLMKRFRHLKNLLKSLNQEGQVKESHKLKDLILDNTHNTLGIPINKNK